MRPAATVPSVKMPAATMSERLIGGMIRMNAVRRLAPSTGACSSISRGR